ncbi:MAG: DUF406 family protein [Aeromonadaceae bacterium]
MSVEEHVQETCEACGCVAEIGSVISEGDETLHFTIESDDAAEVEARLAKYEALAREIYPEVIVAKQASDLAGRFSLEVALQFSCTAEKLIFEMRARAI